MVTTSTADCSTAAELEDDGRVAVAEVVSCCHLRSPLERRWPALIVVAFDAGLVSSASKPFRSAILRKSFADDELPPDFLCLVLLIARDEEASDGVLQALLSSPFAR